MAMLTAPEAWNRFATPIEKSITRFVAPYPALLARVARRAQRAGYAIRAKHYT